LQKIEEGKFELELVPFSFEQVILRVFLKFRGASVKKNLSLSHEILPTVPSKLIGDIHRIEDTISNLLSNAIKFSPDGKSVRVVISSDAVRVRSLDGCKIADVKVSIKDEGRGMSKNAQAKLFDSFLQSRPETIQEGKGSGLSLSFCQKIVEIHGGVINVISVEGISSTFEFTIPFPVASDSGICSE
jgi:signal transduction histidine kinase